MAKQTGHKWELEFGSTSIQFQPRNFTAPQPSRGEVDFTDAETADYQDFDPADLADPGSISVEGFFEPGSTSPPQSPSVINNAPETMTLYFGDSTTSGTPFWSFTAFFTEFSPQQATFNEAAMLSITMRVKGGITEDTVA